MTRILPFRTRRLRHLSMTILATIGIVLVVRNQRDQLSNAAFSTGYALLAIILFLIAFHWRKKLAFLPLGNASTWMQLHIYLAILTAPLFGLHIQWRFPNGWFESLLASLFLLTFASGVWGLYLTRTYPRRLAQCSDQYLFERIPSIRYQLQQATRERILQGAERFGSTTLADFYHRHLAAYIEQPRGVVFCLLPNTRMRRTVTQELASLNRYLSEQERDLANELFRAIRKKDELDYQHALQWTLKSWLVVHLMLSYALLTCIGWHVVMAHAFHGGWR